MLDSDVTTLTTTNISHTWNYHWFWPILRRPNLNSSTFWTREIGKNVPIWHFFYLIFTFSLVLPVEWLISMVVDHFCALNKGHDQAPTSKIPLGTSQFLLLEPFSKRFSALFTQTRTTIENRRRRFLCNFLFWKKFPEVGTFKIITNSRNLSEDNFQPLKMASAAIYWGESGKGQKRPCSRVLRRLTPSKGFQIQKTWILWKETGSSSIVSKVVIFLHLWSDLAVFDNLWQVFFSIFSFSPQFWEKPKLGQ